MNSRPAADTRHVRPDAPTPDPRSGCALPPGRPERLAVISDRRILIESHRPFDMVISALHPRARWEQQSQIRAAALGRIVDAVSVPFF